MGKPRLIILIRHAQSEGNQNREIHQWIPDHRVKLTDDGWRQAEEAGRRLKSLLNPDDTLQIFTSPYRRTRETTEGILRTLTAPFDSGNSSEVPGEFSRSKITVYEEPRLREQDFGNFQPCSAEMERMWAERADYGHFFYRIPNGESASDAYDRVAGFNESLWRQFGDPEFPSVCVLVTHGLMSRVFLMKWYHWSVEYFEDLRNVNHCEFIIMNKNPESQKYVLENRLRTWSELKRQRRSEEAQSEQQRRNTVSDFLSKTHDSPSIPPRRWGGCPEGCNHGHEQFPRRQPKSQHVHTGLSLLPDAAVTTSPANEAENHDKSTPIPGPTGAAKDQVLSAPQASRPVKPFPAHLLARSPSSMTGDATPHEMSEEEHVDYFDSQQRASLGKALRRKPKRQATPQDIERWASESGMGKGRRADALGDEPDETHDEDDDVGRDSDNAPVVASVAQSDDDLRQAEEFDRSIGGSVY